MKICRNLRRIWNFNRYHAAPNFQIPTEFGNLGEFGGLEFEIKFLKFGIGRVQKVEMRGQAVDETRTR